MRPADKSFILPGMESRTIVENRHTLPLEDKGLQVYRGWDGTLRDQLVIASCQSHILQYTPGDAERRFTTAEAADAWYHEHDRVVYSLGQKAMLAGLIWYGNSPDKNLDADYTFAIRMYEASQGQGLARSFLEAAHSDFRQHTHNERNVWLSTSADEVKNAAALRLYRNAGYNTVNEADGRVTMIRRT